MINVNANIYEIDFFGEKVGDPIKSVSGQFESETEALNKFSSDFIQESNINFKVEVISIEAV